ncbi:hypothetical protein [Pseudomonas kurunegalensis]|uniref:hypothetical protein n=1 Tax=Pseudomonas kurunegalensis TaxID=485880 RepID=UPI00256FA892|nr:hypothetical protein [Pseudomonas kurunegalensis]WJD61900.1 hypothetical protein QQ992_23690 [Pseudomonas kurunegalensis]
MDTDVKNILDWLDLTIATHPECLRLVDEELIKKIDELVGDAEVDLQARLLPDGT